MSAVMKCPKCRNTSLSLVEVHAEIGATNFGEVRADERGDLIPPSQFIFEAGDPISVRLQCGACGHEWKPRGDRAVSSQRSYEDER